MADKPAEENQRNNRQKVNIRQIEQLAQYAFSDANGEINAVVGTVSSDYFGSFCVCLLDAIRIAF